MSFFKRTVAALLIFAGCSGSEADRQVCGGKISPAVAAFFSHPSDSTLHVIVTVSDTTGLRSDFPSLRISNSRIALGQLSKEEILALCKKAAIVYIETPKTSFPNN